MSSKSSSEFFDEVESLLPPVAHGFAYGSGVFHQPDLYKKDGDKQPMIDFILVVDDPEAWHRENIDRNRAHYSWLASFGPQAITGMQSLLQAPIYFNPKVRAPSGRLIKYGVIRKSDFLRDLTSWSDLYVAGRLHKPVRELHLCGNDDPERPDGSSVAAALERNRRYALAAALLQVEGSQFATRDLLRFIVGLSYLGDIRMWLAEDPRKVDRIVEGSQEELERIYVPLLQEWASGPLAPLSLARPHGTAPWSLDLGSSSSDPSATAPLLDALLPRLPPPLVQAAGGAVGRAKSVTTVADACRRTTASLVRSSSLRQAALGLFSANLGTSLSYVLAKVAKRFGS